MLAGANDLYRQHLRVFPNGQDSLQQYQLLFCMYYSVAGKSKDTVPLAAPNGAEVEYPVNPSITL